jgi:hypothetical protein
MTPARGLLRRGDYWRLAAVGQLAALPMGMTPLAYTLLTAAVLHSYRVGSVLITVSALAEMAAAPLAGRLIDRLGISRGLRLMLLLAGTGYALLAVAATLVPEPALVGLAVLPALPGGGFAGGVRAAMTQTLPPALLSPAVAMNATLTEVTLIGGPLLAAALAEFAPTAAIGGLALAMAVAAVLLPRARSGGRDRAVTGPRVSLPRRARFARWLVGAFGAGLLFGGLEVGALGLAHRLHGGPGTAALLLALLSGCSALTGAGYAVLGHRLRLAPPRLASVALGIMGCAMAVVAVGGGRWSAVGPAVAALGLCAAPLMTIVSLGAESALPESQRAEGFSLLATAQGGGYAIGSLAVAVLPLSGAQLLGAAGPLVAALVLARAYVRCSRRHRSRNSEHKRGG